MKKVLFLISLFFLMILVSTHSFVSSQSQEVYNFAFEYSDTSFHLLSSSILEDTPTPFSSQGKYQIQFYSSKDKLISSFFFDFQDTRFIDEYDPVTKTSRGKVIPVENTTFNLKVPYDEQYTSFKIISFDGNVLFSNEFPLQLAEGCEGEGCSDDADNSWKLYLIAGAIFVFILVITIILYKVIKNKDY